jgi:hypothetical protein
VIRRRRIERPKRISQHVGSEGEAGAIVAAGYRVADAVWFMLPKEEYRVGVGDGPVSMHVADEASAAREYDVVG